MASDSDTPESSVGIGLSRDGLKIEAKEKGKGLLSRVWGAASSKAEGRAKIDEAMAESIARKLAESVSFSEAEKFFFVRLYEREIKKQTNRQAVREQAEKLLPGLEKDFAKLPAIEDGKTSERWVNRFEEDCASASEEEVRNLYARIAAGEHIRPGSFSLKTLAVVRELEPTTAELFERILPFATGTLIPLHCLKRSELNLLTEYGLIRPDKKQFKAASKKLSDGTTNFYCEVGSTLVIGNCDSRSDSEVHLFGFTLTKAGSELASLPTLEVEVQDEHRREWATQMMNQFNGLTMVGRLWQKTMRGQRFGAKPPSFTWATKVSGEWADEKNFDPDIPHEPREGTVYSPAPKTPESKPKPASHPSKDTVIDG